MPATEFHASSFSSLGRSLLSIRRDPAAATVAAEQSSPTPLDIDLDSFQRHVADVFLDLSDAGEPPLLSLPWLRAVLAGLLACQDRFRSAVILSPHARPLLPRPPLDRLLADHLDRSLKALDLCNAVRDGVHHLRLLHSHLRIALSALAPPLSASRLRRARRALADFTVASLGDQPSSHRTRSFGRGAPSSPAADRSRFRSLSWSVSRSWSAAKQLQAMGSNLAAPRNNEIAATGGLAVPIFTANSVLVFAMWALVAAIPCQDRGLQAHFSVPRSFQWAAAVMSLYERVLEESKRKERRNAAGLLREIHRLEACVRHLTETLESAQPPLAEEPEAEIRARARDLQEACDGMAEGLDALERQVREVFRAIVRARMDGLDCLSGSPSTN